MPPVTPSRMRLSCMVMSLGNALSHRRACRAQTGRTPPENPPLGALMPSCQPPGRSLDSAHLPLEPNVMGIRHWPDGERPRERLLEHGAHALSDAELLAVLLGAGVRGQSAVELARTLIGEFGSLRELLNAERALLTRRRGIGPARYAVLKAALELARRHFREALRSGPALAAPEATRTFLLAQLRDRPYEVFCCLYLDNRHRLIAFEELF